MSPQEHEKAPSVWEAGRYTTWYRKLHGGISLSVTYINPGEWQASMDGRRLVKKHPTMEVAQLAAENAARRMCGLALNDLNAPAPEQPSPVSL